MRATGTPTFTTGEEDMSERDPRIHPVIAEAQEGLKTGRVSRREFIRTATLLGMSLSAAKLLAACAPASTPAAEPTSAGEPTTGGETEPTEAPQPAGGITRGGILRMGMQIPAMDDPARYSWVFDANSTRLVFEYLTETGADNVTRPYLLESWEPNDDLTVWTLKLRSGITWSNGDALTSEDVVYNLNRWLADETGSSIKALWDGFLTPDGIETVDDLTVRLNLSAPKLDVPETLFHYPAQIMHRSFNGDIKTLDNPSTGPYTLTEVTVGERVVLTKREGYWQNGADGNPLPYLDGIEFIDLGDDQTAYVSAIQAGEIDSIYDPRVETWQALRDNPDLNVQSLTTSQVRLLRMRVDLDPWTDNRVRQALKLCQDREKIFANAYFSQGSIGQDVHVAPVQPDYAPIDTPAYDPEGSLALLQEAGVTTPLDVAISVGTGWTDIVAYIETLAADAQAGGFNITLDSMPNPQYWEVWTETAVGVTPWTHRPLAVMLLPLAYIADSEGNPVEWNESRWVDEEFSTILRQAQGTFDIEARRELVRQLEVIQQERGSIAVAWWQAVWEITAKKVQGITPHPTAYNLWREVWIKA
jgi:peptide/nickel transport system substrate-binding protein